MRLRMLINGFFLLLLIQSGTVHSRQAIQAAGIHPDDLALIESHLADLSGELLAEIERFLTDPQAIADTRWFDISGYTSWDDYNFYRPAGDTVLTILARRDLFLDPARQLNNPVLTNMSPEALAALAFSQAYVEEKWDHETPWDGDPNPIFNWIHPDVLAAPDFALWLRGDFLYRERTTFRWATYGSLPLALVSPLGIGRGTDEDAALQDMRPPVSNAPRLSGYSYPVGNQLYLQTAETVYWYADYLKYGAARYDDLEPRTLATRLPFPTDSTSVWQETISYCDIVGANLDELFYPGACEIFHNDFAAHLRVDLTHPESAAFWNVMRFVYAGARQREGGASPDHPENGQPPLIALRYPLRTPEPVGRKVEDVSAFALLTTVYSDSILLDFTNWDTVNQSLIITPVDALRSDGLNRLVSERNKAILVIEQMGSETLYPNATHIAGSRGLGLHLVTQYDDPLHGDFLPYTAEEAQALVMALVIEVRDYGLEASRFTLCHSPLLRAGFESSPDSARDWKTQIGGLCD